MTHTRKSAVMMAAVMAALALAGCVNVLPKVKPVQLYRFGYHADLLDKKTEATAAPAVHAPVPVVLGTVTFPPASAGDQVMTVEDNEVAYVAQARWASSASSLFTAAINEGFARSDPNVMLVPLGPTTADYRLDVSVRRFETGYGHGHPTVYIGADARLIRLSDRSVVAQHYISADITARHNDMSDIADAFNQATTEVVTGLTGFTDEGLQNVTPPATPDSKGGQKVEGL